MGTPAPHTHTLSMLFLGLLARLLLLPGDTGLAIELAAVGGDGIFS